MSQLDYLWTNFGGYEISDEASLVPSDKVLLTEKALSKLVSAAAGGGIVKLGYRNHPTNAELAQIVGTDTEGNELTVAEMPREVHVTSFGAATVTSEDATVGCTFSIGTNVIKLELSDGKKFYFNLDAYVTASGISGAETETIKTTVTNGIISSDLKIRNGKSVIRLKHDGEGLHASLRIDDEADTGIRLEKSEKGLKATLTGGNLRFIQCTYAEYLKLDDPIKDTVYIVTDYPFIYLNGMRYGVDMRPGEFPIVSLVYDADHMLLSYKKSDGSDIQHIHLGPATEDMPGMLSKEDYASFKSFAKALEGIVSVKEYVEEETGKLGVKLEYGEPKCNKKPLHLKDRNGNVLSTVWTDIDNYLAAAETKVATELDVEKAKEAGNESVRKGDQILIQTMTNGDVLYVNLNELVDLYIAGRTRTITLSKTEDNVFYGDLNVIKSKLLYIKEKGLGAKAQVYREGGWIELYGKHKTEDCLIGKWQSPSENLVGAKFIPKYEGEEKHKEYPPEKLDWEDLNEYTNKLKEGEPYYVLIFQEYTDNETEGKKHYYWISIQPLLAAIGIAGVEGNILEKDEHGDLYVRLEWNDLTPKK